MNNTENSFKEALSNPETLTKICGIISSLGITNADKPNDEAVEKSAPALSEISQKIYKKTEVIRAIMPFLDSKSTQKAELILSFLDFLMQISKYKNDTER